MKNSVEKIYKNGALSKLGKKAAVILLCLCLMVSFVQNVAFKATYAETVSGSDIPAVQVEEPAVTPEEPVSEEEQDKSAPEASTPEVSTPEVSTPEVSTPEVSTSDKKDEPAPVVSSSDAEETEPAPVVSSSDAEETVSGSDLDDTVAADVTEKHQVVAKAVEVLGAPSGNLVAEGTCGTCSWAIDDAGVLTIYPTNGVSGTLANGSSSNMTFWPWFNYANDVTSIVVEDGVCTNSSAAYLFYGMENCTSMDLSGLDTSNATSLEGLFSNCSALTSLDVSGFNTSNVTNMRSMFYGCRKLTTVDVSGFDTSKVTNMSGMFSYCNKLTSLNVSNFKTSNVTNMSNMFNSCSALTSLDVSGFNTSNVTNMNMMFYGCEKLTTFDVGDIDTSKVTNMSWLFGNCSNLNSLNVSGLDTSNVTNMSYMFQGCHKLTALDVSGFDTSKVTNMSSMFGSCRALTTVDVSNFNTSNVTNMSSMFVSCSALTSIDVSGFDTSNVTNMSEMFVGDTNLNTISVSANFTPATNYAQVASANFFNVVDGSLIYTPKHGYAIKSLTINGQPVEFDAEGGTYAGFTGDSKATITFDWARTVTFMDNGTEVEKQAVAHGGNAKDPYADTANRPEKPGYEFIGWDKDITNIQSDLTVNAQWKLALEPQITFTSDKAVGEKLTVYLKTENSSDTVFVDWGDGTLVEYTVTDDPSDDELPSLSAPIAGTGEIKFYSTSGIVDFRCGNNQITSLDAGNCPSLADLSCSNNSLTQLDLSGSTALVMLTCENNPLTDLDITDCPELTNVLCSHNQLTELDFTGCTKFESLQCDDNQLRAIDVTDCPELVALRCKENQLEKLDISANSKLEYLDCSDNNLSEIIMPGNPELSTVLCNNNKLTELDISGFPKLEYFECNDNLLEKLTVSDCPELFRIYCFNNQLTELDASDLPKLMDFHCYNNKLRTLDLTGSSAVEIVLCINNQLTELDLSDCPNIGLFACQENSLRFSTIDLIAEPEYLMTHPQAKVTIPAETAALSGVVDLSSEYDIYGNTTVYTWYDAADDSVVTPKTAEGGKFTFDASAVGKSLYCTMTNAYYPDLTLETTETKITFALEPQITFTTDKAVGETLKLTPTVIGINGKETVIYVDLGDGNLVPFSSGGTAAPSISAPVAGTGEIKVYSENKIIGFSCQQDKITSIDTSGCPWLESLDCAYNQLTELDVSSNANLERLSCDANQLTELDVSENTQLAALYCNYNKLTELDLSKNTQLADLSCSGNQLTELDVSNNTQLATLYCDYNKLTELDVSDNAQLTSLHCSGNQLTELDLSNNTQLAKLYCDSNKLTELDASNNTKLATLYCGSNALRFSTIYSGNSALTTKKCSPQPKITIPAETAAITGVVDLSSEYNIYGSVTVYKWYDASNNKEVTPKTAEGGKFTFNASDAGKSLYCKMTNAYYPDLTLQTTETKITFGLEPQITFTTDKAVGETLKLTPTVIGISGKETVIYVDLGDGNLVPFSSGGTAAPAISAPVAGTGEIKVYSENMIIRFNCSNNAITSLDTSGCPTLEQLTCDSNKLTSLDFSENAMLKVLDCEDNQLTFLDVTDNAMLTELYCTKNQLAELDVSKNALLAKLDCSDNLLTDINVANNTQLVHLNSCNNQLTNIDVANNTQLNFFGCGNNQIKTLDLSNNTKLTNLWCYENQLSELDLSNNTKLTDLLCYENQLSELDLSNNTNLTSLLTGDNQLSELDLDPCTKLSYVECMRNALRFSTLKAEKKPAIISTEPQAKVTIPAETEANVGVIDLSSEYDIYGNITVYKWYDAATNEKVTPKTAEGGKFTFDLEDAGKSLYCKMTNDYYSDLTLETTATKIFYREFILNFDVNGGDALPADEQSKTVIYSEPVGELPTPTKAGHTFTGWLDSMSVEYTADTVYMVEGDTTLTAQWKVNKYKVNYHLNEAITEHPTKGVLPEGDEVDYNTEYTAKFPTEINGYTFFGWYTDEGYTAEFVDGTPITEDTDLYGHWSRDTITIGGMKTWVENGEGFVRPDSITVNLYQNGTPVDSCVVPKDETANVQFYSFKEMYISDEDSNLYEYTVAEETVPDKYVSVVTGHDITNTFNVNNYTITKQWDNTGNPDEIPESVDVELLCDGTLYKTVTLSKENGWGENVTIPSADAEGHEFTVREITVPGYTTEYKTEVFEDGVVFTLTNTYIMPQITIGGDIEWKNVPQGHTVPDMNVSLILDGNVIDTVTVPAGTESYEFTSLDRYDDEGNALAYTVKADALANYDTEYSASVTDENGNITIGITNTGKFAFGTLTVTNFVTGNDADPSLTFSFKVEIGAPGSYQCRIVNATKSKSFSLKAVGDVYTVQSGDVIELAGGESAVISGILDGTAYSVTELDSKGYKVTSTGEKGNVTAEGASAVFTNTKNREVKGDSDIPDTGDDYNRPLVIGITAGFALLLAVCVISFVISKKRKNAAEADISFEESEE